MLGELRSSALVTVAEFMICQHGSKIDPRLKSSTKNVTAQWIKYCLEVGAPRMCDSSREVVRCLKELHF